MISQLLQDNWNERHRLPGFFTKPVIFFYVGLFVVVLVGIVFLALNADALNGRHNTLFGE